jgi:hypothetical protein
MESSDRMCKPDWDPQKVGYNTAGCAQLQSGAGDKFKDSLRNLPPAEQQRRIDEFKKSGESAEAKAGQAAPSIEDKGSCDVTTVGHEALGHSMWGHDNGDGDGNGIKGGGGGIASRAGWTAAGCQAMRENAFGNDGKWRYDAKRTQYYTRENDPAKQWSVLDGKPLFRQPPGAPPPGDGKPPRIDPPAPNPARLVMDESAPKAGGASGAKPDVSNVPPGPSLTGTDIKHKPRPGESSLDNLLAGIKTKARVPADENDPLPPQPAGVSPPPPSSPPAPPAVTLMYDESAPKQQAATSSASNRFQAARSDPPPSGGGEGMASTSLTYDEGAPKGQSSGGGTNSISVGKAVGSARLTYDESAPKGQAPSSGGLNGYLPLGPGMGELSPAGSLGSGTVIKAQGIPPTGLSSDFFKEGGTFGDASGDDNDEKKRRRAAGRRSEGESRRAPASLDTGRRAGGGSRRGGEP